MSKYSLDEKRVVQLGGVPQHIRIRGTDRANPVLLFLHGGPGVSDRHWVLKDQSGLADVCTMVCWDQRGAGKSYSRAQSKEKMTIDMMVNDARELVEYLCAEFDKDKIHVVGHSWGTMLGTLLCQRHPEHIAAYVGMGQVVDLVENENIAYKFTMDEAIKRGDKKGIRDLEKIGEPKNGSYGTIENLVKHRDYLTKYGGETYAKSESIWTALIIPIIFSPEYTLADLYKYAKGSFYCLRQLWPEIAETIRFNDTVKKLDVPVYMTEGRHDINTPSTLAKEWFDNLEAPHKDWVWFEKSAHSPIKEEPELWGKVIREKLFSAKVTAD